MSDVITLKLYVNVSDNSLDVLQYIDKNLTEINKMGVFVTIELLTDDDIDEDMKRFLAKKGIVRLPSLLSGKKTHVGVVDIKKVFANALKKMSLAPPQYEDDDRPQQRGRSSAPPQQQRNRLGTGNGDIVDNFYMQEIQDSLAEMGRNKGRGKSGDKEDDALGDGDVDFNAAMAKYDRNMPKHRRPDTDRGRPDDSPPRRRRQDDSPPRRRRDPSDSPPRSRRGGGARRDSEDNVGDFGGGGGNLDDQMMNAFLENNTATEGI